jgi:hypothetical protein
MERSYLKKMIIAAGLILFLAGTATWALADGQGPGSDPEKGDAAALAGDVPPEARVQEAADHRVRIKGQSPPPEDWDGTAYHVERKKDFRPVHQNVWLHPRSKSNYKGRVVKEE